MLIGNWQMGTVHELLEARGKQGALEAALIALWSKRLLKTLATKTMASDSPIAAGRSAPLPIRFADDATWGIAAERITLMVEPGRRPVGDGPSSEFVGIPFGSHARLILLFLQTEALRTGNREVELGGSLRGWLGRIGISVGGMTRSVGPGSGRTYRPVPADISS